MPHIPAISYGCFIAFNFILLNVKLLNDRHQCISDGCVAGSLLILEQVKDENIPSMQFYSYKPGHLGMGIHVTY